MDRPQNLVTKVTAVLAVEAVEPSINWFNRVGFDLQVSVAEGQSIGFAILTNGACEIMLQRHSSIAADTPYFADFSKGPTYLFIETSSLDQIIEALKGEKILLERRKTFYGADEIGYRESGGHVVVFAEFAKK